MKVLLDSGVWWRRTFNLPMDAKLVSFLKNEVTEWWLSPFSIAEMVYKVKHRGLAAPDRPEWFQEAVKGYNLAPLTFESGRAAGDFPWTHGDPVDRMLAATALVEGLTLIHTDTKLKELTGFPHRYFKNAAA